MRLTFLFLSILLLSISCDNPKKDKESTIEKAIDYFNNEEYAETLVVLNNLIEKDPTSARYYYLRFLVYDALGKYEEEIRDLNEIIDGGTIVYRTKEPEKIDQLNFFFERATAYGRLNQSSNALEDVNYIIENGSVFDNIGEPYSLALAYILKGSILYQQERILESKKYYTMALEKNSDSIPEIASQALIGLANLEKNDRSLHLINQAVAVDSTSSLAYGARGVHYFEHFEPEKALIDFHRSLYYEPNNGFVTYNLGQMYATDLKNKDSAIFYLRRTLSLEPQHPKKSIIEDNLTHLQSQ